MWSAARVSLVHEALKQHGVEFAQPTFSMTFWQMLVIIPSYHLIKEVFASTKCILSASGRVYGEAMSAGPDWSLGLLARGHAQSSFQLHQPHKTLLPLNPKDFGESIALISTTQMPCQIVHGPRR